jgi:glycosyltransferase involved in cell wall biosynthesis
MLEQFFENDVDLSSIGKSTYQVLRVPNVTSQAALDKDSYILVMENVIKELNKIRDDLFFHIPITKYTKRLDFDNTKQYIFKMPSFPNAMRAHYDFYQWNEVLNAKKIEMDIIWSHLPEQTTNIKNHCHNIYSQDIPVIGYSHWIENSEFAPNWKTTFYHNNITGMLQMDKCGLNTQTQIDALLEEASEHYSQKTIDKLKDIMIPLYLGVEQDKISKSVKTDTDKVIVFNHRTKEYRGWKNFIKVIKELRSQRQDFKVFCSMIDPQGQQMLKSAFDDMSFFDFHGPADRDEYIAKLENCRVGFHGGTRWAMSSQDGLCKGIPYVYEIGKETEELFGSQMQTGFTKNSDAIDLFNRMLDDNDWRNEQSQLALDHCSNVHTWSNRIVPFNNMITEAIDKQLSDVIQSGDKKDDIVNFVKKHKMVDTQQMSDYLGWGKQIGFRRYRNYLRTVDGLYTTMINKKEYYVYNENFITL